MLVNEVKPGAGFSRLAGWRPGIPLLLFLLSCLIYLINIGRAPHPDELYHLLAARGLLEHGEPRIADGLYTRVFAYTWLVGRMFALLGESLAAARLPSVLAMAAVNTLLFVWLRREAGWRAAAIAVGLFMISPFTVEIAQFARFYALQTLFFLAGSLIVYAAARRLPAIDRWLIGYGLAAAACFAAALYLQPTTLLGMGGVGLWLLSAVGIPWLADSAVARRPKVVAIALFLATCAIVAGLLLVTGIAGELWFRFRWVPVFLEPRVDEVWFYHLFFILYYPSLWPVIGLLCLAALATWPRVTWFAMVVFALGFLLNSLAGPKSLRYLAYAQPFVFALFGLGLAAIWSWMARASSVFRQQLETHLASVGLAGRHLPDALLWSALLVVLIANAALLRTAAMLADIRAPLQPPLVQWQAAEPVLESLLNEVEVVVTVSELQTLYFWGRFDVIFSPSRLSELSEQWDFALDHRTGRPVISTREALARLVDCTASGLLVATSPRWRTPQFIDVETANFIEQKMTRIDLPPETQLIVFTWAHAPARTAAECATVREALAPGSG